MTRKKTESGTPIVPAPPRRFTIRGPEKRDDGVYLAREDLLLVEMYQAKTLAALQAIALSRHSLEDLKRRHEAELRSAQIELAAVTGKGKEWEEKCGSLWKELGEVYHLDFQTVTYDDETGRITTPEDSHG